MTGRAIATLAGLTLRETARRRVIRALVVLTAALLALSAFGFSRLAAETDAGGLGEDEARLVTSQVLNLVMFGLSLVAALGTAFVAGPTLAGELESGQALAVLARPVRRSTVLVGKWLGLVCFGTAFVLVSGTALLVVVRVTVGQWPPDPVAGLALLAAQTTALLTLSLLLSTAISPMASGIVAVGLFGTAWIAGVVGGVGAAIGNAGVERAGSVSRVVLPTDGLWRGAMHAFQDTTVLARYGVELEGFPFLSMDALSPAYLAWASVWTALVLAAAAAVFRRRDL